MSWDYGEIKKVWPNSDRIVLDLNNSTEGKENMWASEGYR